MTHPNGHGPKRDLSDTALGELINRVRLGDPAAAAELALSDTERWALREMGLAITLASLALEYVQEDDVLPGFVAMVKVCSGIDVQRTELPWAEEMVTRLGHGFFEVLEGGGHADGTT